MAQDAVDEAIKTFNLTPKAQTLPDITTSGLAGIQTTGTCCTRDIVLMGAHGFSKSLASQLMDHYKLDVDVAKHLASNYGDRAWNLLSASSPSEITRLLPTHPFTEAEVRYAVREEAACTGADLIARRTRLAFLDVDSAQIALPRVIEIMGKELGWSKARSAAEWTETVAFLKSMGLSQDKQALSRDDVTKGSLTPKNKALAVSSKLNMQVSQIGN